jgi:hypothetical protein
MGISYKEVPLPMKIALARSATGPANSPEAAGVLDAAGRLSRKFLNVELPMPDSSATLTHNGEDIAVAMWRPTRAQVVAPILLWDDPVSSTLVSSIPSTAMRNPNQLEELLTGLFVWGAEESEWLAIKLNAQPQTEGEILQGSAGFHRVYQMYVGPELTVSGYVDHGAAWLSVTIEKTLGSGFFDRDMLFIAERFPPLRTRVPQWTTTQLLAAIGHGGRAQTAYNRGYAREVVLLHELIPRQDLTSSDFRSQIARSGWRPTIGRYLPEAIRAATQSDSGKRFVPAILEYFSAKRADRHELVESEAADLMRELAFNSRRRGFCEVAVAFLNDGLAVHETREYTDRFCSTSELQGLR